MNMKSSDGSGSMSRTVKLQIFASMLTALVAGAGSLTEYFDPKIIIFAMLVLNVGQAGLTSYIRLYKTQVK